MKPYRSIYGATQRAKHFSQWMWLGVVVGFAHGLLKAPYSWNGSETAIGNLGQALVVAISGGLLARGACWFWLRGRSKPTIAR
jgi:hypothetical protein